MPTAMSGDKSPRPLHQCKDKAARTIQEQQEFLICSTFAHQASLPIGSKFYHGVKRGAGTEFRPGS